MRPIALGRQDGPKVAAILYAIETRRRRRIPAREHLAAVLPGLADPSIQRVGRTHAFGLGSGDEVTPRRGCCQARAWPDGYP